MFLSNVKLFFHISLSFVTYLHISLESLRIGKRVQFAQEHLTLVIVLLKFNIVTIIQTLLFFNYLIISPLDGSPFARPDSR